MIKYLEWDSKFFGYKIGEVIGLPDLDEAKDNYFRLVYARSEHDLSLKGFKDHKVIYQKKLVKADCVSPQIQSIIGVNLSDEILNLAITAGHQSRFRLDSNFKNDEFSRLYSEWIKKSLSGELADEVLAYIENGKILGLITIKLKETTAQIGLMVISHESQGKGLGGYLTKAAESFAVSKKVGVMLVSTQFSNEIACRFYEKSGYNKFKEEMLYHVWI